MRVLVTGAAGFIGSHLAERLLADGHEVTGVDCFTPDYAEALKRSFVAPSLANPRFRFLEADLRTTDPVPLVGSADVVYHLAAQAGVRASFGPQFADYVAHNILATHRLLEAARAAKGLKLMVYASSASVYGDVPVPMREEGPTRPTSPYGITKLAAEQLCLRYAAEMGVPAMAFRFFNVFGPRQRPYMAFTRLAVAMMAGAEFPLYGNGAMERDFTEVGDIVDTLVEAAKRGKPGMLLNIGGGHRISLLQAIEVFEKVSGKKALLRKEPARMGEMARAEADNSALKAAFGFAPKVSLEAGLARQWAWAMDNSPLLAANQ